MKELINNREYEDELEQKGINYIAGVDEVGRGPLIGNVVAACCVLSKDFKLDGLNDSKKLTDKKRRELFPKILSEAVSYAVVSIDNNKIDEINILEASRLAMEEAIKKLSVKPDYILTDAMKIHTDIPYMDIIKGDIRSYTIGCASIIAKVIRDDLMIELSKEFPGYEWEKNKGYPTKKHKAALYQLGITKHHRVSYEPVKVYLEKVKCE